MPEYEPIPNPRVPDIAVIDDAEYIVWPNSVVIGEPRRGRQ